jgi:hypothetical protein
MERVAVGNSFLFFTMKIIFIIPLVFAGVNSFGQYYTSSYSSIHFQNRSYGFVTELPLAPPGLKGDFCIYDEWNKAEIYMKDSTVLRDINVRIDVKDQRLEIEHSREVKLLPFRNVLAVSLHKANGIKEEYININAFKGKDGLNRLVRIMYEGEVMLLCEIRPEVISADYNAALDVGRKDNEVVLKKKYFIVKDKSWIEVDRNNSRFRDEMIRIFGTEIETYIRNTNTKKEENLLELVKELNGRFKS